MAPCTRFLSSCSCLSLLALFAVLAAPAPRADEPPRQVQVVGEAERRVAPDMAWLRMAAVSEHVDPAQARAEADAIVGRALGVLARAGVADGDIDSSGLQVTPQYRWSDAPREQQLVGYRITRRLEVRLLDLDRLGGLLVALSETGINQIDAPEPGLADPEAIYREVLAAAAANARERAVLLAATLGESLGDVLRVTTHDAPPPMPMPMRREAMLMASDAVSPGGAQSYQSGDLSFRVTVSATFELD